MVRLDVAQAMQGGRQLHAPQCETLRLSTVQRAWGGVGVGNVLAQRTVLTLKHAHSSSPLLLTVHAHVVLRCTAGAARTVLAQFSLNLIACSASL